MTRRYVGADSGRPGKPEVRRDRDPTKDNVAYSVLPRRCQFDSIRRNCCISPSVSRRTDLRPVCNHAVPVGKGDALSWRIMSDENRKSQRRLPPDYTNNGFHEFVSNGFSLSPWPLQLSRTCPAVNQVQTKAAECAALHTLRVAACRHCNRTARSVWSARYSRAFDGIGQRYFAIMTSSVSSRLCGSSSSVSTKGPVMGVSMETGAWSLTISPVL